MSVERLRILILGGYGVFGGRLAALIADEPRLTLIIAGRSQAKAAGFCARHAFKAKTEPLALDRAGDLAAGLRAARPDVVVDATGPFQHYAGDPYGVVRACLAIGCDYLDFADGSGFVAGISAFDAEALRAQRFVLSGVSSFPVLTAAAVRHLAAGLTTVETISGGIAPSPYAVIGLNVVRAVASYAGQPVKLTRDGRPATAYALTETLRYTIAPPGLLPLRNTRFSLVDVPDLTALPPLWPGLKSIWMGAGPVPSVLHRGLNVLATLVRRRLLPTLSPFARVFHGAINTLRWGEHRGGMFVELTGRDPQGVLHRRSWHLLAEGDDGPLIPSMAIEAIIRKLLTGKRPNAGARAATTELSLADYEPLFAQRRISTGTRQIDPEHNMKPLYARALGDAWRRLPEPIRRLHTPGPGMTATGSATVERGSNWVARLVAALFRFPPAGRDVPLRVTFTVGDGREVWRRDFAGATFASEQREGAGRDTHLIVERFGPLAFGLALVVDSDKLRLVPRTWRLLGIPMPAALMPYGEAFETAVDGRFHFNVEIRLPLVGRIVRYRGVLVPS